MTPKVLYYEEEDEDMEEAGEDYAAIVQRPSSLWRLQETTDSVASAIPPKQGRHTQQSEHIEHQGVDLQPPSFLNGVYIVQSNAQKVSKRWMGPAANQSSSTSSTRSLRSS